MLERESHSIFDANIKVIGIGGAGCNAINRMIDSGISGVEFYSINTDLQSLANSRDGSFQLQIGANLTHGLGSGSNPEIGRQAAEEDREQLDKILDNANMVFIAAGLGGGTGTGAAPFLAAKAKEKGILTICIVTTPFRFEGQKRASTAESCIDELRAVSDGVITVSNQRLIDIIQECFYSKII